MDSDSSNFINNSLLELLEFLIYKVKECICMLEDNTYNDYINENLSYKNRFDVVKDAFCGNDYIGIVPDEIIPIKWRVILMIMFLKSLCIMKISYWIM